MFIFKTKFKITVANVPEMRNRYYWTTYTNFILHTGKMMNSQ